MRAKGSHPQGYYTMGIALLFLVGFLLLVIVGAQSYRQAAAGQAENMEKRSLLSYLSTAVKGHDSAGGVSVRQGEFGPVLVLDEQGSGYALRIYCKDGVLLEDFASLQAPLNPAEALTLGRTARFEAALEQGLLRLETDAGSLLLHLHSGGGAP